MATNKTCDQCDGVIEEEIRHNPTFTLGRMPSAEERETTVIKKKGWMKKLVYEEGRSYDSYDLCSTECLEAFISEGKHK